MLDALDGTIADAFDQLASQDDVDGNPTDGPDTDGGDDLEPDGTQGDDGDDEPDDDGPEGVDSQELEDDSEPDDDDGDDAPDSAPIEVSDDDVIRLPDGTEVPVKESALRQADYTRKTQELADQRRALEQQQQDVQQQYEQLTSWVQERSQDPVKFAAEIAASTGDPTLGVAKVIKHLADSGQLDPQFAEAFGLTVNETIDQRNPQAEIDQLKQTLEQDRQQREQAERQQQVVQHYLGQWGEVKATEGLQYGDLEAEKAAFRSVLEFARDNKITDLRRAYAAYAWENRDRGAPPAPAARPDPAVSRKKRAASAVTPRSSAGNRRQERPKPRTTEEAAGRAFDEVMARA